MAKTLLNIKDCLYGTAQYLYVLLLWMKQELLKLSLEFALLADKGKPPLAERGCVLLDPTGNNFIATPMLGFVLLF